MNLGKIPKVVCLPSVLNLWIKNSPNCLFTLRKTHAAKNVDTCVRLKTRYRREDVTVLRSCLGWIRQGRRVMDRETWTGRRGDDSKTQRARWKTTKNTS